MTDDTPRAWNVELGLVTVEFNDVEADTAEDAIEAAREMLLDELRSSTATESWTATEVAP